MLMATNGVIIGLTRFVQYQSFVMLFSVLAVYYFSLALKQSRWKTSGIYAGMLSWAAALLTHYDGIFIAPFALYLLYRWYMQDAGLPASTRLKRLAMPGALSALVLLSFYVPFFTSVDQSTLDYWLFRFTETSEVLKPSSSIFTFNLYNPLFSLYFYCLAGLFAFLKIKPALPALAWFLFPWIVLEVVLREPGTHIYTYLLPAFILVALGLVAFEELLVNGLGSRPGRILAIGLIVACFAFIASLDHFIFVDNTPEYPWMARRFLFWKLGGLTNPEYQVWTYGFPYYRHWDEVREYVMSHDPNGYYSTNEEKEISNYYIPMPTDIDRSGYYIHIYCPLDLKERLEKDKICYWMKNHPPVKEFKNGGLVVTQIYLMPEGDITEIRNRGY